MRKKDVDMFQDVLDFHKKFGCAMGKRPKNVSPDVKKLRKTLMSEEFKELKDAMQRNDLVGIADAGADLIYVVLGTMVSYGIDVRPIWEEVHRTNMAKESGGKRADGKILKPQGWNPPNIKTILDAQENIDNE